MTSVKILIKPNNPQAFSGIWNQGPRSSGNIVVSCAFLLNFVSIELLCTFIVSYNYYGMGECCFNNWYCSLAIIIQNLYKLRKLYKYRIMYYILLCVNSNSNASTLQVPNIFYYNLSKKTWGWLLVSVNWFITYKAVVKTIKTKHF